MNKLYENLSTFELEKEYAKLKKEYNIFKEKNLSLDMSRGKPDANQLNLSMGMLNCILKEEDLINEDGFDCRNYGILSGVPEMKRLASECIGVAPQNIIIGGNSSLNMMYDIISQAVTKGLYSSEKPWNQCENVKFICPSPGYDRHFRIAEHFGFELISVDMLNDGPDINKIEQLVNSDSSVKGMWCVPKYSNPTGVTYSDEIVKRLAALKPAAPDFRVFWDNAYCVHGFYEEDEECEGDVLLNIMDECVKANNQDMIYIFMSTSKITFPGAGVSALGASANNIKSILKNMSAQTIGADKINQLRHVKFLKNYDGIKSHMKKHAELLRPKFKIALDTLQNELGGTGLGEWVRPRGGYFISFNAKEGCAARIYNLCKSAGVKLTEAGATYPHGHDPADKNLRIAPTYPPVEELEIAMKLFCICAKMAGIEKMI